MSNKLVLIMSYTKEVDEYGTIRYYKDGKFHRDGDKPAVIYSDGTKFYYKNGKKHRDGDKPAALDLNGYEAYYKNGERHRDGDKPAVIYSNGTKYYYKNGVQYTKEQVEKMEEIRTRIVNRIAVRCARYWYDETYRDTEGEAFQARMMRDMDYLENEIGYVF